WVDFYDNGVQKFRSFNSGAHTVNQPYQYNWAYSSHDNGGHQWTVVAYDVDFNAATSAPIQLTISLETTAPAVSITNPPSVTNYIMNSPSTQAVPIIADAADNIGVTKVEFYDNGVSQ